VIRLLWPSLSGNNLHPEQYRRFTDHVVTVISDLRKRCAIPEDATMEAAMAIVIRQQLLNRSAVAELLNQRSPGVFKSTQADETLKILEAVARIWSMILVHVGELRYVPGNDLFWADSEPLSAVVKRHFDWRKAACPPEPSRHIDTGISAAQLVHYNGVRILWTSNLAEHLAWNPRSQVLRVFEHKVWIWNYLRRPEDAVVPADVLDELMCTLNLLFPLYDAPTRSLLEKDGMMDSFYGLGYCGKDRSFEWSRYKYWRREIQGLNDLLSEPPKGISQFWRPARDRRNLLSLALFWLSGVMVFALTIIGSVCGILSVQYSKEQTRLSELQWNLSVALVCRDPEIRTDFQELCGG
jgi:hypothetical protein